VEIVGHSVEPISDDRDIPCNHVYSVWGQTIAQAGRITGKSFSVWQTSARHLKHAGFVDIFRLDYKWPVHGYVHILAGGDCGLINLLIVGTPITSCRNLVG
jgi:hypothetical protein